jgi:preprotein translocase subunit SecF
MLRILHGTNYDFIKPWRIAIGVTVAFIATGLIFLGVHHGLNRSIEFTGGTLVQAEFKAKPDVGELRSTIDAAGFQGAEIQQFGRTSLRSARPVISVERRRDVGSHRSSRQAEAIDKWSVALGDRLKTASWPSDLAAVTLLCLAFRLVALRRRAVRDAHDLFNARYPRSALEVRSPSSRAS